MSQTNDICPKCKKPCSPNHTLIGFDGDVPKLQCHRKPGDGPDPNVEGVNLLWNRMESAEANASKTGADLDKKTAECKDALARIAVLERESVAQKNAIAGFQAKLTKADADRQAAVNEAILATEQDMGVKLARAQSDLEKLDKDFSEKLRFKEQRLVEAEKEIVKLRGTVDETTAGLVSAHARADAAEAEAADAEARVAPLEKANANLQTKGLRQAKANLELNDKIGDLRDRLDEMAKLCKDNGLPVSEIVFEIKTVTPEQIVGEEDETVLLDQIKKPSAAPVVPPPLPAPPPPAQATVAAAQTGPVCTCCGEPATKVAKDKWRFQDGTAVPEILSCKKLARHVASFFNDLDSIRDQLMNPPDDPSELLVEFEDITPNA